jgi:starch-binding outer membrane protein, SusD/RagB family
MKNIHKKIIIIFLSVMSVLGSGCSYEYPNPNAATEDAALSSVSGLLSFSTGIRFRYSIGGASPLYTAITASGLTTNELRVVNAGNADIAALANGRDNVNGLNPVIINMWQNMNILNADCEKVIANVSKVTDRATANAIQANAHLFKALALGTMAQFWERVPLTTGTNAQFSSRQQALEQAVTLLDQAVQLLGGSVSPVFTAAVGNDIDLPNALNALSARYNLMLGRNAEAIAATSRVSMTSRSQFAFDNISQNPIFRSSFVTNNVHETQTNMGLPAALAPAPNDGRLAFYLTATAPPRGRGFFKADNDPIPLYLPSEMTLIRAEALARTGDLAGAVTALNQVLQKTTDIWGLGANLPAYSGANTREAILLEIYRNRCIELYLTGMRLEDSRRFSRPGPTDAGSERNRNFYPYPNTERDNNPNTPPDPAN